MTERRTRGNSPAGRGDRRTSRAARSRPAADMHGRADAATRVRRRIEKKRMSEHTVLGLSTGRAVILAMVVCALAMTLAVPMRTYLTQRAEAAQLAQERRELEDDLAGLRARRDQQRDPAYIRSEARDRLRLVMPGETPYIVQVPGIEAPAPPDPSTSPRVPDPWYTDLWRSIAQPRPGAEPQADDPAPHPEGPR